MAERSAYLNMMLEMERLAREMEGNPDRQQMMRNFFIDPDAQRASDRAARRKSYFGAKARGMKDGGVVRGAGAATSGTKFKGVF